MSNRAIKFRLFDIERERYISEQEDQSGGLYTIGLDGTVREQYYAAHRTVKGYLIEQFTGLTDKNGKEIYEGDIVENGNDRGPVVFENGRYYIDPVVELRKGEPRYMGSLYWGNIVGNVHENPELLKQ